LRRPPVCSHNTPLTAFCVECTGEALFDLHESNMEAIRTIQEDLKHLSLYINYRYVSLINWINKDGKDHIDISWVIVEETRFLCRFGRIALRLEAQLKDLMPC
jgi:hypothetical protein